MKRLEELSATLNEEVIAELRREIEAGRFPGVTFDLAMRFALTSGVMPADGLPVQSFIDLESWLRCRKEPSPIS